MKYIVITKMRECNELLDKGFRILKVDRDKFDRTRNIYLFEPTDELLNYIKNK